MNEVIYCPKCRETGNDVECHHLASDAWECPLCGYEFQLKIMPMMGLENGLTNEFSSGILD